jgi:hypothetical protein
MRMRAWARILHRLGDLTAFGCTVIVGIAMGCALSLGEAVREAPEIEPLPTRDERQIDR